MKPTSQPTNPAAKPEVDRVAIDYTYLAGADPKGKLIYQGVRYTRVGSISEREAIARGWESDEYMDRRERVRKGKIAAKAA